MVRSSIRSWCLSCPTTTNDRWPRVCFRKSTCSIRVRSSACCVGRFHPDRPESNPCIQALCLTLVPNWSARHSHSNIQLTLSRPVSFANIASWARVNGRPCRRRFAVLRCKLQFDHFAPSGSGSKPRRMAILGFSAPRDFLDAALSPQERQWLDVCQGVARDDLLARHRHNLPEWLAEPLEAATWRRFLGAGAKPAGASTARSARQCPERQAVRRSAGARCRWGGERQHAVLALGSARSRQAVVRATMRLPAARLKSRMKGRNCSRCCSMQSAVKW